MVVRFFVLKRGSNARVATPRLKTARNADAGNFPFTASLGAAFDQGLQIGKGARLGKNLVIIAAVIFRTAWNSVRELVGPNEIPAANREARQPEMTGHPVECTLDRDIGRRHAESPNSRLPGLVRRYTNGLVFDAIDLIGPDNRTDRLAKLQWRPPGLGACILQGPQPHRTNDATIIESDGDRKAAVRSMHVTT